LSLFHIGGYFPPEDHKPRIERYRKNKKLFKGNAYEVFEQTKSLLNVHQRDLVYISTNLPGIICKKSADFLFGETPTFSAGKDDNSNEQKALERHIDDNELHITNYESALSNAYRGDSFYKIRYGQQYSGLIDTKADPFRVFIESQNPEYVFPEALPTDANTVFAYHIAYPQEVAGTDGEDYVLHVESHYPGEIRYSKFKMAVFQTDVKGNPVDFKIYAQLEIPEESRRVLTNVPAPLIVHVPNYSTDDSWEGIDDLSENESLFDELNCRLSFIAMVLNKHSDPAIAVPHGAMDEDENGQPVFHVARDKVFEVMDKNDFKPEYITWNGHLDSAFKELEFVIDQILINAELPAVALGRGDSGTSGSSGLSIKWRMNSLLAKINRKRQYYDKGLKQVLYIAQLLEQAQGVKGYEATKPRIRFKDGLPNDEKEQAVIANLRTGGAATISQKTALMWLDDLTEEQAEKEIQRMRDEEQAAAFVDSSIFNREAPGVEDPEVNANPDRKGFDE
jgi:Phage portal protein, SPP1 Gp6-like